MLLRSLWLLISAGTILLLAASIAPRHQMLRADVYGLSEGLAGMGLSLDFFATYFVALELLVAAGALLVSALIAWKRGDDWFAVLVATMLAILGLLPPLVEGLVYVSPGWALPVGMLRMLVMSGAMAVLCLFPNGRFAPPWTRWLLLLWLLFALLVTLFDPLAVADTAVLPNTRTLEDARWLLVGAAWFLAAIAGQVIRYRRHASPAEKQQMKWVLFGFSLTVIFSLAIALLLIGFPGLTSSPQNEAGMTVLVGGIYLLTALVLPVAIALSILRYRLWDVDILLNRTLVYGGLTLSITAVYVLLVGGLGTLAVTRSGYILGLILATALVLAFLRSPLRARWQTAMDRLVPVPDPISEIPNPKSAAARLVQSSRLNQSRSYRWLVWLSVALAIVLTAANMGVAVVSADQAIDLAILMAPAFVAVGTLIIMRQPQNRIGRLCLLVGWVSILVFLGLNRGFVILMTQSDVQFAAITQISLSLAQLMVILIFVYLPLNFPDGQFSDPGWRRFWHIFAGMMALIILLILVKPGPIYDWAWGEVALPNPLGVDWPLHDRVSTEALAYAWAVPAMLAFFAAIGSLIMRWRRSSGQARQQVKWVVFFLSTVVALFMFLELVLWLFNTQLTQSALYPVYEAVYGTLGPFAWVGLPLVIGLAVFKYRLYDIDIIINRTLVYGGLSLAIVALYVVAVGALGTLFQSQGSFLFALLATGLIAVLFQPVRGRLQQGVNRLMFGERDDPYKVLSQLGQQLQTASTPQATLQSLVETIASTLKLPYAAITLRAIDLAGEEGRLSGAATGTAVAQTAEFPLRYQNETVGYLVVSARSPGESFTEREQQLLADIAGQAGAMAYSVRLTAALQQSREKMVLAREEERRRIRRDLHDELGPTLASQTFALDTALEALESDPQMAAQLLQALKSQNQETVSGIRRLVYELRPPALDELGVVGALQAQAGRLAGYDLLQIIIISEPYPLPPLPAAVEVAAYRITLEAMTNVARHARAGHCLITLRLAENGRQHLNIAVTDDGIGLPYQVKNGVGMNSMRERAEELGGSFEAGPHDNGGTRITAVLPLE